MSADAVRLTTVANEVEAEMVCSLLVSNGIEAFFKRTDAGSAVVGAAGPFGPTEVWVSQAQLAIAQEFLNAAPDLGEADEPSRATDY